MPQSPDLSNELNEIVNNYVNGELKINCCIHSIEYNTTVEN